MGRYENAIPWLKKYVEIIRFINDNHNSKYIFYSLVISLEECAKQLAESDRELSKKYISEALHYAEKYHNEKDHEITMRLKKLQATIDAKKKVKEFKVTNILELPQMQKETKIKAQWTKLKNDNMLKGYQSNSWMKDGHSILFFNNEKKSIIQWQTNQNKFDEYNPKKWPEGCGRMVFNENEKRFYMWSSINSSVFILNDLNSNWEKKFSDLMTSMLVGHHLDIIQLITSYLNLEGMAFSKKELVD